MSNPMRYMRGKCDNKKGGKNPSPKVSRYKRRSGITKGDIMEVRVYHSPPPICSLRSLSILNVMIKSM